MVEDLNRGDREAYAALVDTRDMLYDVVRELGECNAIFDDITNQLGGSQERSRIFWAEYRDAMKRLH